MSRNPSTTVWAKRCMDFVFCRSYTDKVVASSQCFVKIPVYEEFKESWREVVRDNFIDLGFSQFLSFRLDTGFRKRTYEILHIKMDDPTHITLCKKMLKEAPKCFEKIMNLYGVKAEDIPEISKVYMDGLKNASLSLSGVSEADKESGKNIPEKMTQNQEKILRTNIQIFISRFLSIFQLPYMTPYGDKKSYIQFFEYIGNNTFSTDFIKWNTLSVLNVEVFPTVPFNISNVNFNVSVSPEKLAVTIPWTVHRMFWPLVGKMKAELETSGFKEVLNTMCNNSAASNKLEVDKVEEKTNSTTGYDAKRNCNPYGIGKFFKVVYELDMKTLSNTNAENDDSGCKCKQKVDGDAGSKDGESCSCGGNCKCQNAINSVSLNNISLNNIHTEKDVSAYLQGNKVLNEQVNYLADCLRIFRNKTGFLFFPKDVGKYGEGIFFIPNIWKQEDLFLENLKKASATPQDDATVGNANVVDEEILPKQKTLGDWMSVHYPNTIKVIKNTGKEMTTHRREPVVIYNGSRIVPSHNRGYLFLQFMGGSCVYDKKLRRVLQDFCSSHELNPLEMTYIEKLGYTKMCINIPKNNDKCGYETKWRLAKELCQAVNSVPGYENVILGIPDNFDIVIWESTMGKDETVRAHVKIPKAISDEAMEKLVDFETELQAVDAKFLYALYEAFLENKRPRFVQNNPMKEVYTATFSTLMSSKPGDTEGVIKKIIDTTKANFPDTKVGVKWWIDKQAENLRIKEVDLTKNIATWTKRS